MNLPRGLVYYIPQSDGTGEVAVITFTPRPEEEVKGMSLAEFDPVWLVEFMQQEPNIERYRLVLDNDGNPSIDVYELVIDTGRYEESFYQVEPYCNAPGVVLKSEPDKGTLKLRVWGCNDELEAMRKLRFSFFITKTMEPNVLLKQFSASIGEIVDSKLIVDKLPLGEPNDAYSIWAVSPDATLRVWWTTQQ